MAINDEEITQAETAMRTSMENGPRATAARYDRRRARLVVSLNSGLELAFPPHLAEGLDKAEPNDLAAIEISPSGLGLHWPKLDADLYLPSLMAGVFGSPGWMARSMGQKGGSARSEAKTAASRANGRRGGRPRKAAS